MQTSKCKQHCVNNATLRPKELSDSQMIPRSIMHQISYAKINVNIPVMWKGREENVYSLILLCMTMGLGGVTERKF